MNSSAWRLSAFRKGFRPLVAEADGLLCYSAGKLYRLGYELNVLEAVGQFPSSGKLDALGRRLRFLERIFRLGPSHAIRINDRIYFSRRSDILVCDLNSGNIKLDFVIPDGRRLLRFGVVHDSCGTERIVFGEYFNNPGRAAVRLWGRSNLTGNWVVLNEFAAGEIEHIHGVFEIDGRILILCGDFDQCAGIWESDPDFACLEPLLRGSQSYRACWVSQVGQYLLYATDSQLEINHLCELQLGNNSSVCSKIRSVEGSSIYFGQGFKSSFFSTAVEGGSPTGNFILDMLSFRRGPGITSSRATIVNVDSSLQCAEVFSAKKDFWPFGLGQFGTFTFPTGIHPEGTIVAYATALGGVDNLCMVFKNESVGK